MTAPWRDVCVEVPTKQRRQNLLPAVGLDRFSLVAIQGATKLVTPTLENVDDHAL